MLQSTLDVILPRYADDIFILGRDVNATVADFDDDLSPDDLQGTRLDYSRKYLVKATDLRGEALMNFMNENGFILLNGTSRSDSPARFTSSKSATTHDLAWVNLDEADLVYDMKVCADLLGSNQMVGSKERQSITVQLFFSTVDPSACEANLKLQTLPSNLKSTYTPSATLLWRNDKAVDFVKELGNSPIYTKATTTKDIDARCFALTKAIKEAATVCGMSKPVMGIGKDPLSRKRTKNPWFDGECASLKKELHKSYGTIYKPAFDKPLAVEFDGKMKTYKKLIKDKKAVHYDKKANRFANIRNPFVFWKTVASAKSRPPRIEAISLDAWNDFLQSMYPPRAPLQLNLQHSNSSDISPLDKVIQIKEISICLKHVKKGKAPGEDNISNEFLKALPLEWRQYLLDLFNEVFRLGKVPTSWTSIVLCMIHKKCEIVEPLNYRGIALVNNTTKTFTSILNNRFYAWAEENNILPE
ncbi:uncharacterized protein LOC107042460 [Diachasma alloeum]|uniref:uncharacterized protein LOC107042460 n=1 Tax=Diachasma alloeum TaxID=454923 RepID=UPI00073830D1|nr:uncharacterized protein LOC107042460 [Diachasma alloeum]